MLSLENITYSLYRFLKSKSNQVPADKNNNQHPIKHRHILYTFVGICLAFLDYFLNNSQILWTASDLHPQEILKMFFGVYALLSGQQFQVFHVVLVLIGCGCCCCCSYWHSRVNQMLKAST